MMLDNEMPLIDFTAEDRCDRCGAQAYTLAKNENCGELLFCLHHRRQHVNALLDEGWEIVDDYEAMSRLADNFPVPA